METITKLALSTKEERIIHIMQLLGDKTRYKIFKLLVSGEEMCVSDIAEKLNVSVSAVSQHFKNFEMLGLVNKERLGQKICYAVRPNDTFVDQIIKLAKEG